MCAYTWRVCSSEAVLLKYSNDVVDGEFETVERKVIPSRRFNTPAPVEQKLEVVPFDAANNYYRNQRDPLVPMFNDGDKFPGGFGVTKLFVQDYYALRARSSQLFKENLYARGMLRRLITNEINSGLTLESRPENSILGLPDDFLDEWTDDVEIRFDLWAKNRQLCDYKREHTFYEIQQKARLESLIEGDVLVVLRVNTQTGLPNIELIPGSKVISPLFDQTIRSQNEIKNGVEIDNAGRQAAYWIAQKDGKPMRLPAFGPRSGRRMAWLMYGTERRMGEVRGEPLLSIVLQSLKEIDRYRDSAQRKAVINSILAMFIKKNEDKPGTRPIHGGAIRRKTIETDSSNNSNETAQRSFDVAEQWPGMVIETLQHGEEPIGFNSQGTDVNFPLFEDAIVSAMAWAHEIPPDIMRLAFTRNYAGNQGIINEFKQYIDKVIPTIANGICVYPFHEWFYSEVLNNNIEANGFLEARRNIRMHAVVGAWLQHDWLGKVKPSTDPNKTVQFYQAMVDRGWMTNARAAREVNGTKFTRNLKVIRRELEQLQEVGIMGTPEQATTVETLQATMLEVLDRINELEIEG